MWIYLSIYFMIINIVAYSFMGHDKRKAKKQARRIPEKTLFFLAALGGALGTWVGMRMFRHKTKHRTFQLGIPLLIILNLLIIYGLWYLDSTSIQLS